MKSVIESIEQELHEAHHVLERIKERNIIAQCASRNACDLSEEDVRMIHNRLQATIPNTRPDIEGMIIGYSLAKENYQASPDYISNLLLKNSFVKVDSGKYKKVFRYPPNRDSLIIVTHIEDRDVFNFRLVDCFQRECFNKDCGAKIIISAIDMLEKIIAGFGLPLQINP